MPLVGLWHASHPIQAPWRPRPVLCAKAVARLTADNLVFLMASRKAEGEAAAAAAEVASLRLAVEKQRGPWFDEARCTRVQLALLGWKLFCA
jgi:hypothetical protein